MAAAWLIPNRSAAVVEVAVTGTDTEVVVTVSEIKGTDTRVEAWGGWEAAHGGGRPNWSGAEGGGTEIIHWI